MEVITDLNLSRHAMFMFTIAAISSGSLVTDGAAVQTQPTQTRIVNQENVFANLFPKFMM